MAGKKSKSSGKVSMGGRQRSNLHHEEKRQAYFKKKREEGRAYEYHKNPYDKKTQYQQWHDEDVERRDKAKSSRLPYARLQSVFAKLDNELAKERLAAKEKETKRK